MVIETIQNHPHIFFKMLSGFLGIEFFMFLSWIFSIKLRDASIVDRLWGINFILLTGIYFFQSHDICWRHWVTLLLISVWGVRLSLHIHFRNQYLGEDFRYQTMRRLHGRSFWWYSLFSVFFLQGFLAFLISAPIFWIFTGGMASKSIWDLIAIGLWSIGFFFEVVGDAQLKKFKSDRMNKGKVLNHGLWSLTRHPNYFGDALIWWSMFFLAISTPSGWMTFFGPLIMSFFLRYISGATLLEKSLKLTKPEYANYVATTPAFIPRLANITKCLLWKKDDNKKNVI